LRNPQELREMGSKSSGLRWEGDKVNLDPSPSRKKFFMTGNTHTSRPEIVLYGALFHVKLSEKV